MKMSFAMYMLIPIAIAVQAFTMMVLAPYVPLNGVVSGSISVSAGLLTWISFQAWAMYFLAGCTPKMGVKTLLGYGGGIIASIAIFELGGLLSGLNTETTAWGLYLAVLIVVVPVIAMEKVPWFDFVPAYFVGAGVFFGIMTHVLPPEGVELSRFSWYGIVATAEMVACAVGLVYGAITVYGRGWYEGKFGEQIEEEA